MMRGNIRFAVVVCALLALNGGAWWWYVGRAPLVLPASVSAGSSLVADEESGGRDERGERAERPRVLRVEVSSDAHRLIAHLDRPLPADGPDSQAVADWSRDLAVEPPQRGEWVLATPERLDFQFLAPPAPGTSLTVRVRDDAPALGAGEMIAHVPMPALREARLVHRSRESLDLEVRLDRPVARPWLRGALTVRARNGAALEWMEDDAPRAGAAPQAALGDLHRVRVARPAGDRIRLEFAGTSQWIDVPERFTVLGAPYVQAVAGEPSVIDLRLTDALADEPPLAAITVTPRVDDLTISAVDQRLRLRGTFDPGTTYRITLPGALASAAGERLESDLAVHVAVHPPSPRVRFPDGSGLIAPGGTSRIRLETVGVREVSLSIVRVHDDLLVPHLRGLRAASAGRVVAQRTIRLDDDDHSDAALLHTRRRSVLDLSALIAEQQGLFLLRAADAESGWASDSIAVARSRLAPVVRTWEGGMLVWVTDLSDAAPRAGATVRAMGPAGRTLAEDVTDQDGIARLAVSATHPDGPIVAVLVRDGDDAMLERIDRGGSPPDGIVGGGRAAPHAYDILLYAERGVHQPGETLRMTALVRTQGGDTPDDLPIELRLHGPDRRLLARTSAVAARESGGFLHVDLPTLAAGATGLHRVTAHVAGSERVLASVDVPVEPYVPATLLVSGQLTAGDADPPNTLSLRLLAERIGGRPAAGLSAQVSVRIEPQRPRSAAYPEHLFGVPPAQAPRAMSDLRARSDGAGEIALDWRLPDDVPAAFVYLTTSVTETSGRSRTHVTAPVALRQPGALLGLRVEERSVASHAPIALDGVLLDAAGSAQPAPDGLRMQVERVHEEWVAELVRGEHLWRSVERREIVVPAYEAAAEPAGSDRFRIVLPELPSGRYVVTARAAQAVCVIPIAVHGEDADPQRSRLPDLVHVEPIGEPARPGERATILVRAPFAGTALLSIEDEQVRALSLHHLPEGTSTLEAALPNDLRGASFVTVTLVRGIDVAQPQWQPHRAAGAARLPLSLDRHRLRAEMDLPARARPGEELSVRLRIEGGDAAQPVAVHLWAVDEGIVQAVTHAPIDPLSHFLGDRRHRVRHFDARRRLLPDHAGLLVERAIGGDRDEEARRRGAHAAPRTAVVLFREAIMLGTDGEGAVTFTMPDVDGALRFRLVAARGDAYGHVEGMVTAAHTLRIMAAAPRALAPSDTATLGVRLVAGSDLGAQPVTLRIRNEGALASNPDEPEEETLTLSLHPEEERVLALSVEARREGAGILTVIAHDASGTILAEGVWNIPVRSAQPVVQRQRRWTVEPGSEVLFPEDSAVLRRDLMISADDRAERLRLAEMLIEYPHGCAEQTVGRLRGLLAVGGMERGAAARVRPLVQEGLSRLRGLQRRDGGLTYWPGGDRADLSCTALAAMIVAEAEKFDVTVPAQMRRGLIESLDRMLLHAATGEDADDQRVQALAGLAALGEMRSSWVQVLAHRSASLDAEARAMLGIAAHRSGYAALAHRIADDLIGGAAQDLAALLAGPADGAARFRSPITRAAAIDALLERVAPDHALRGELSAFVQEEVQAIEGSLTTVEAAAMLSMLSTGNDDAPDHAETGAPATVKIDGVVHLLASGSSAGSDAASPLGSGGVLRLRADGVRVVRVPASGSSLRVLLVEELGASEETATGTSELAGSGGSGGASGHGLSLARRWSRQSGEEITWPATVAAGELILVELELRCVGRDAVRDVAIVDPIPGGFEIEHPGLAGTAPAGGIQLSGATRAEIRDDRMVIFTDAAARPVRVRYAIRAVVPGNFTLPAAEAQAMYDVRHRAVTESRRVEVAWE